MRSLKHLLTGVTLTRRTFLGILGGLSTLALNACRRSSKDSEFVSAQVRLPVREARYAVTLNWGADLFPLVLRVQNGKPLMLEVNDDQSFSLAPPPFVQSMLHDWNGSQRLTQLLQNRPLPKQETSFQVALQTTLQECLQRGREIHLFTTAELSPVRADLLHRLRSRIPGLRVISSDTHHRHGWWEAMDSLYDGFFPHYSLKNARMVVALESDFLGTDVGAAMRRREWSGVSGCEIWSFEGGVSTTGQLAAEKVSLDNRLLPGFLYCLLSEICLNRKMGPWTNNASLRRLLKNYDLKSFVNQQGWPEDLMPRFFKSLMKHRDKVLFVAGDQQSAQVHVAAELLNQIFGAEELRVGTDAAPEMSMARRGEFEGVVRSMKAGRVGMQISLCENIEEGWGIAYGLSEEMDQVLLCVRLHWNQSAEKHFHIHLPVSHPLEKKQVFRGYNRALFLSQQVLNAPEDTIRPAEDYLLEWFGRHAGIVEKSWDEYLSNWQPSKTTRTGFLQESDWERGWLPQTEEEFNPFPPAIRIGAFIRFAPPGQLNVSQPALFFRQHPVHMDGRTLHTPWINEIPHPLNRSVWGSFAAISAEMADRLGVPNYEEKPWKGKGPHLKITSGRHSVSLPVRIFSEMHSSLVQLYYTPAAKSQTNESGRMQYPFQSFSFNTSVVAGRSDGGISGDTRNIVLEYDGIQRTTLTSGEGADFSGLWNHSSSAVNHKRRPNKTPEQKWGMWVDAQKCSGCQSCVLACNIENNIPVVGPEQYALGRDMHWLQILPQKTRDGMFFLPLMCQHCENAPCESMCPVHASVHEGNGLNHQNNERCIGARSCLAACPYQVRRFNFLDYQLFVKQYNNAGRFFRNLKVTERPRGVAEKCTLCVHRIQEHQDASSVPETACQQACPSNAIQLVDFSKLNSNVQGALLLEDYNTLPDVFYRGPERV